jgi:hypothetical protein
MEPHITMQVRIFCLPGSNQKVERENLLMLAFRTVTPCGLLGTYRRFGGKKTYCLLR